MMIHILTLVIIMLIIIIVIVIIFMLLVTNIVIVIINVIVIKTPATRCPVQSPGRRMQVARMGRGDGIPESIRPNLIRKHAYSSYHLCLLSLIVVFAIIVTTTTTTIMIIIIAILSCLNPPFRFV